MPFFAIAFAIYAGCATALPPEMDRPTDTETGSGAPSDSDTHIPQQTDSVDTGTAPGDSDDTGSEVGDSETGYDTSGDSETVTADCGDGFVTMGQEECDGDGKGIGGETATCDQDCTVAECGDKTVNASAGEFCDDGDFDDGDGCDSECHREGASLGKNSVSPTADDTFANGLASEGPCNEGSVAIGIFGAYGQWFDIFGVRCQALDSTFRLTGEPYNSGTVGRSTGGSPFGPLLCPNAELLVGVTFEFDNHFRSAEGHCRSAAAIYAGADNGSWTGNTELAYAGGTDLERATLSCPSGSAVTGVAGFDADYPAGYASSIQLLCRQMAP